jgi:hypothetical protein
MPTNFPNGLFSYGMPVGHDHIPFSSKSKTFFVEPRYGNNGQNGDTLEQAFASVVYGEDALAADRYDTLLVFGNDYAAATTTSYLAATLTWDKDLTNMLGICSYSAMSQRARIAQLSTATSVAPLVNITASGCTFRNLQFFHGVNNAASLGCVKVTGAGNYFENVHFAGGGHAANAIDGGYSLSLDGAEENRFVNCTFGVDTIDAATGMMAILMDSEAHRNEFINCRIRMRASNGGAGWVEIIDATGIDRDNLFDRCVFLNNSATAMDSGFVIPAGMGAPRKLFLRDCMGYGATKWDASDRGVLYGNMNAVTGADGSGVAVQMIT